MHKHLIAQVSPINKGIVSQSLSTELQDRGTAPFTFQAEKIMPRVDNSLQVFFKILHHNFLCNKIPHLPKDFKSLTVLQRNTH